MDERERPLSKDDVELLQRADARVHFRDGHPIDVEFRCDGLWLQAHDWTLGGLVERVRKAMAKT